MNNKVTKENREKIKENSKIIDEVYLEISNALNRGKKDNRNKNSTKRDYYI
jgi:hypothetical protein